MRAWCLIVFAVAAACAAPPSRHSGVYEPHLVAPDGASMAVTGTTLELRPDGGFEQQGFPEIRGRWREEPGAVVLAPETKAGMDAKTAGVSAGSFPEIRLKAGDQAGELEDSELPDGSRTVWRRKP